MIGQDASTRIFETAAPARAGPQNFVVVVNPAAGACGSGLAAQVAERLRSNGCAIVVETAAKHGRIYEIAKTAMADAVLVAGGDGSVNEAARGLLERPRPRPALGIIPQGTVNILADELRLPADADDLAAIFARGATAPLHLGLANGRPFALMASAGVDAAVVAIVDLALKEKIGRLAYVVAAAKFFWSRFWSGECPDVAAHTDAGDIVAKCVIVAKSKYYGGRFVIDRSASVLQPGLSLVAVSDFSLLGLLAVARYFLTGKLDRSGRIRRIGISRASLRGSVATQIDGDFSGAAPLDIRPCDETLDVLI